MTTQDGKQRLVPSGQVIGTAPAAGRHGARRTTLMLNVSTGAAAGAGADRLVGQTCGSAATT